MASTGIGSVYASIRPSDLFMIKLMELLRLRVLEPQEVAIENLAADTLTMADEVARRRESLESLGFPFAEALELDRKRGICHYAQPIDD